MNVYFLSGLGADKRIFSRLVFTEHFKLNHIEWIPPIDNEALDVYCSRLSRQIDQTEPFILIGVSFGGLVAIEIAKVLRPLKIIIISSISGDDQLPWYYKLAGLIQVHKVLPVKVLKISGPLMFWFFGASTKEAKVLLTQILKDTDADFLKWAISKILSWKQKTAPDLFQIHGTADHILPSFAGADLKVKNGGHLMVYDKSEMISNILAQVMIEK